MFYIQNILWGYVLMIIGLTLPGMVNMTAVKVSIEQGIRAGFRFSLGSTVALIIHAYLAITFANFLSENPYILLYLKRIAVVIFAVFSLLFFFLAQRPQKPKEKYQKREDTPFIFGFLIMFMNMLNIPFLFAMGTILEAKGWISLAPLFKWLFIFGAAIGCWTMMLAYTKFAEVIKQRAQFFAQHLNYFLSGLFMLLAILQLIQLVY